MFVESAKSSGAAKEVMEADWPTLARIVQLLEGLPLGIHLAAPRLRVLGTTGLLRILEADPGSLSTNREGVPDRHRSLRHALAGSFDLLSPAQREAMGALSVLRGGWTLEAAAHVWQADDPEEWMQDLLDASLVERRVEN